MVDKVSESKNWLTTVWALEPVGCLEIARDAFRLTEEAFSNALPIQNLAKHLSGVTDTFKALSIIPSLHGIRSELKKEPNAERHLNIASKVGDIFTAVMTSVELLDTLKIVNMGKIGNILGKTPVIGKAIALTSFNMSLFGMYIGVSAATIASSVIRIKNNTAKMTRLQDWEKEDYIQSKINNLKGNDQNSLIQLQNNPEELKQYQNKKIEKWTIKTENLKLDNYKKKKNIGLHTAIATAFIATIIFTSGGLASLPAISISLATLWLAISIFGVWNSFDNSKYGKKEYDSVPVPILSF